MFRSYLSTDVTEEHTSISSSLTFTFLHFLAAIDLDFLLSDSRGTVYVQVWFKEQNISLVVGKQTHV